MKIVIIYVLIIVTKNVTLTDSTMRNIDLYVISTLLS